MYVCMYVCMYVYIIYIYIYIIKFYAYAVSLFVDEIAFSTVDIFINVWLFHRILILILIIKRILGGTP